MQTYKHFASALLIAGALMSQPAAAQPANQAPRAPRAPGTLPATPQLEQGASTQQQSAEMTRSQLHSLLQQYPPSLERVLQLDPSLLDSADYISPYPLLSDFLARHPEIAHNPSYFLGEFRLSYDQGSETYRMWRDLTEGIAVFLGVFTAIGLFTWLIRTLIDYRRWHRMSKVQTEVHSKLLDRLTDKDDLLAYIQTPAGKRFLESAPIPTDTGSRSFSAPIGRIMWSAQTGLVLAFGGVGLYLAFMRTTLDNVAEPFFVVSILAIALGIGFIVSAAISYIFSLKLGLLEGAGVRPNNKEAATGS